MKKIYIFIGSYLPGNRVGGPVVSIANLVEALGDEFEFHIVCLDHDLGQTEKYPDVEDRCWTKVGKAYVYYTPFFSAQESVELTRDANLLYLCGCFSADTRQVLKAHADGRIKAPVIVAPMGLFSPGALSISKWKKKIFLGLSKAYGFYRDVTWSVTSEEEAKCLQNVMGMKADYRIAQDLPHVLKNDDARNAISVRNGMERKKKGKLSLIFLSRITREKNLLLAVSALQYLPEDIEVEFRIYGPVEDKAYFEKCKNRLEKLPANVTWTYGGPVAADKVVEIFSGSQLFIFPTLGENYGHVINEALSAGCPVIVSDKTPWTDLEENGAGMVLELPGDPDKSGMKPEKWTQALTYYANMDSDEYDRTVEKTLEYVRSRTDMESLKDAYRRMFLDELAEGRV